ncbi:MAG: GspE/PulE family protein [Rhodothermales bacterium]
MEFPPTLLLTRLPQETMRLYRIIPLKEDAQFFSLGVSKPPSIGLLRDLSFMLGKQVVPVQLPADEIESFLKKNLNSSTGDDAIPALAQKQSASLVASFSTCGSVVQQVDALIATAIEQNASDIHIEPYETVFRIRYRLDGVLHKVGELSLLQKSAVISRLKIMAALDIAEKRRPQDGRIRFDHDDKVIDLRVSTLPTVFGEKVVLRILDKSSLNLDLKMLGFSPVDLRSFRRTIHLPFGMVLVTGPTGSGKTTTLYAALNELNSREINITTIEDPIEYNLAGINQAHVRSDIGFTFAQALRAFLRQDPDVIMVGEMRDKETVDIAVRASLTGHLVLSTIHTNDASSTVVRLTDMGVEPFLVGASVKLVIAQRLVRRICDHCKTEAAPDEESMERLSFDGLPGHLCVGEGCEQCRGTGYQGRTALFEVMPITEQISEMITREAPGHEIRKKACEEGMRTLREVSTEKMLAGITTIEEVLRETIV